MAIPSPLPEEMLLRPSRLKWGLLLAVCMLFVLGCVAVLTLSGDALGLPRQVGTWLGILFFGVCAILALDKLRHPSSNCLRLGPEGFEESYRGVRYRRRWEDVSEFSVRSGSSIFRSVTFNSPADDARLLGRIYRIWSGRSGWLSDTFSMDVDELAELMNAFRDRALASRREVAD